MVGNIKNLTRAFIPKLSANAKENIASINAMPEMVLNKMIHNGDKSIVHVDMNQCVAARITPEGINTIYTDALNGCNSIGIVLKLKNGNPLAILSHYVPTNTNGQVNAIEKQLDTYNSHIDKSYRPRVFCNIRGFDDYGKFEAVPNEIVEKVKTIISKFFSKGLDLNITPYPTKGRGAFFSSANIFQFDPQDLNKLKITNVGEKEKFIDLKV